MRDWRRSALVLRLTEGRMLVIGLQGKQFVGGLALRDALVTALASRRAAPDAYTVEEGRALSAHFQRSRLVSIPPRSGEGA